MTDEPVDSTPPPQAARGIDPRTLNLGPDPDERLYTCHQCLDWGFTMAQGHDRRWGLFEYVKWCRFCDKGLAGATGEWLEIMFPQRGAFGARVFSESGERRYDRWAQDEPHFASRVKEKVLSAKDRDEAIRKRRAAQAPQGSGWAS